MVNMWEHNQAAKAMVQAKVAAGQNIPGQTPPVTAVPAPTSGTTAPAAVAPTPTNPTPSSPTPSPPTVPTPSSPPSLVKEVEQAVVHDAKAVGTEAHSIWTKVKSALEKGETNAEAEIEKILKGL